MNIFKKLNFDYISFDIFDTLLYRKVNNLNDIHFLTEEKLVKIDKKFKGFANLRIKAEEHAHSLNKVEATIFDIYDLIQDYTNEEKKLAMKIELETEKENLVPNLLLKQLINNLKSEGKKIIIITDMYLTKEIISDLLAYNGIIFDYLFVSSELQLRKHNGKLFDYVINYLKINKKDIIHIGDNKISDLLMPRLRGIKSALWKKIDYNHTKRFLDLNDKNYNELYDFLSQKKCLNYYEEIGYKYFGPVLYGFCRWIKEKSIEYKLDDIIFLSRDGQIVKKAYSLIYDEKHTYFLASRRSLTVPLLYKVKNTSELLKTVPYIKRLEELSNFLSKIGIEDKALMKKLQKKYGNTINREFLLSNKGNELFCDISTQMKKNSIEEQKAAKNYICENLKPGKIGIVDIGWYGTMQKSLEEICNLFNIKCNFYGLYFGLLFKSGTREIKNAKGYIYDYKLKSSYAAKYIYGFNGLIELLFTANHGSAKKYSIKDKKTICELENANGEYTDFVSEAQKGALEFIKDVVNNDKNIIIDENSFVALQDLLLNPTLQECYLLGNLKFFDIYFEKIIQFTSWKDFIRHPKDNIKKFLKSNWKIGYIKEMFKNKNPKLIYNILNMIK